MRQQELVSGFSELKDLLITTYRIEQPRELVKLYFSETTNELLMHDYDDHSKFIILSFKLQDRLSRTGLTLYASRLVILALNHPSPSIFLNHNFKLYGFFRPYWR